MLRWLISNILWAALSLVVIFFFYKRSWQFFKAVGISKKILTGNRDTRGNGWGKYSADRFIDIWYSKDDVLLTHERGRFYAKTFNNPNSRHWMDVIDRELSTLSLIEIFENDRGARSVRPIQSWRNGMVEKLTRFYLVHFIGDNPQYYKDLKEQSERP